MPLHVNRAHKLYAHIAWKVPEESSKEAYNERLMEPSRELTGTYMKDTLEFF